MRTEKKDTLRYHTTFDYPSIYEVKLESFILNIKHKPCIWTEHFWDNEENPEVVKEFLSRCSLLKKDIFEFTVDSNNNVDTANFRMVYDRNRDLCVTVSFQKKIITYWFNDAFDEHDTLDRSKYNN